MQTSMNFILNEAFILIQCPNSIRCSPYPLIRSDLLPPVWAYERTVLIRIFNTETCVLIKFRNIPTGQGLMSCTSIDKDILYVIYLFYTSIRHMDAAHFS